MDEPPLALHLLVCMQVPLPDGVEHALWVQHLMSDEPSMRE